MKFGSGRKTGAALVRRGGAGSGLTGPASCFASALAAFKSATTAEATSNVCGCSFGGMPTRSVTLRPATVFVTSADQGPLPSRSLLRISVTGVLVTSGRKFPPGSPRSTATSTPAGVRMPCAPETPKMLTGSPSSSCAFRRTRRESGALSKRRMMTLCPPTCSSLGDSMTATGASPGGYSSYTNEVAPPKVLWPLKRVSGPVASAATASNVHGLRARLPQSRVPVKSHTKRVDVPV